MAEPPQIERAYPIKVIALYHVKKSLEKAIIKAIEIVEG